MVKSRDKPFDMFVKMIGRKKLVSIEGIYGASPVELTVSEEYISCISVPEIWTEKVPIFWFTSEELERVLES